MPESAWSALGMLAAAILILVLAWWVTKKIGTVQQRGWTPGKSGADAAIAVLETTAVGRNERVVLVRMGGTCFLLGVTEKQITVLKEFSGAEAEALLTEKEAPPAQSFGAILRENLWKRK